MSDVFKFKNKTTNGEKNVVPSVDSVKNEKTQKKSFSASVKDVGQLKEYFGKIEEIYAGLIDDWKASEEQLKAAKNSLVEYQVTAAQDIKNVEGQMEELRENMSQQHKNHAIELAKILKEKDVAEQLINEANAELMMQKKNAEQNLNDLNKCTQELNVAYQEINFLKIQLEAEKDILKSTVKNHDQVIRFLKKQLSGGKDSAITNVETVQEPTMPTMQDEQPIITTDVKVTLESTKSSEDVSTDTAKATVIPMAPIPPAAPIPDTPISGGGGLQQNRILTAQKTREQLKQKLQGLQASK